MKTYGMFDPEILEGSYWGTVEACYSRTWSKYQMQPHYHQRVEIMYLLRGTCRVHVYQFIRDHSTDSMKITGHQIENLSAGEYIFLDAGVLHQLEVPYSCYMTNIEFSISKDERSPLSIAGLIKGSSAFESFLANGRLTMRSVDDSGRMYAALSQVIDCFAAYNKDASNRALMDMALGFVLLKYAQDNLHSIHSTQLLRYAKKAMALLRDRQQENVKIADIAEEIGINPSYLQRVFKQAKGQTMIEYLNQLRIERAKFLLSCTEDPIVDIAIHVGFNSRQHFSHTFLSIVGTSPQVFRQQSKETQRKQFHVFGEVSAEAFIHFEV